MITAAKYRLGDEEITVREAAERRKKRKGG